MLTDTQTTPVTLTLDPASLADHPLLSHIPVWAKESEEFKSLRESLRTDGQLYEILVDSDRRVVDGRNRRNALAALGRPVVARVVDASEVSTIIFRTLMQRRHVTSGARAFLAVPLVQPLIAAARARQIACLKRGDSSVSQPLGDGVTIDQLALDCGVSRATFDYARKAHELLAKCTPEVRAKVEQKITDGDVDLARVHLTIQNLTENPIADEEAKSRRNQHQNYIEKPLHTVSLHWEKATEQQRENIVGTLRTEVAKWPEELLRETELAIKAAMKLQQGGIR